MFIETIQQITVGSFLLRKETKISEMKSSSRIFVFLQGLAGVPFVKMNTMMFVLSLLILVGCNGSAVRDMTFDSLESETGQKVLIACK